MASPGALQPAIREIVEHGGVVPGGIIGFSHTIFLWQSLVSVIVELIVVTTVMWLATPPPTRARTRVARHQSRHQRVCSTARPAIIPPGAWLEHSPLLMWLVVALGAFYLGRHSRRPPTRSTR
jgi:short-chain fatty acids transporter